MSAWLLKSEPHECSFDTIRTAGPAGLCWDGIRNYLARNHLRDRMRLGDVCLIYHSNIREPGIQGEAEIIREAYPDPAQFDPESKYFDPRATPAAPRWVCVDIRHARDWPRPVMLATIRRTPELADMVLLHQGRLSVQPVAADELALLRALGGLESR